MPLKGVSNSLGRLHRMGFLRRRRGTRYSMNLSPGRLFRVRIQDGLPRLVPRRVHFRLCRRGFEHRYSLSRQGVSYINWLSRYKPIQDFAYQALLCRVMDALPEDLRNSLAILGAARGNHKYRGPTRQLNLIDNPANPLWYMLLKIWKLEDENKKQKLELLSTKAGELQLEIRVKQHEEAKIKFETFSFEFLAKLANTLNAERAMLMAERAEKESLLYLLYLIKEMGEAAKAHSSHTDIVPADADGFSRFKERWGSLCRHTFPPPQHDTTQQTKSAAEPKRLYSI